MPRKYEQMRLPSFEPEEAVQSGLPGFLGDPDGVEPSVYDMESATVVK